MICKQYINDFENLGFGMFVHFGVYSVYGAGTWAKYCRDISDEEYLPLHKKFNPQPEWAKDLVKTAKKAGCKYITLTTRHHDGFSLYDVCGLNEYDAIHGCGRDLVREFVDACCEEKLIPFFYHTLLDWHDERYKNDFKSYLKYLRSSIEILCRNYGKIGGLWFDGMWDKPDEDWEEDELYTLIRKYQPEAMIINNTGLSARGEVGHIEIDSVTFERGNPQPINHESAAKYVASEMCEIMGEHWGYAREDLKYKSPAILIQELAECRRYGANFLLNVGPKEDGSLRLMDSAILELIGEWTRRFDEAIYKPKPTKIEIENKPKDFILQDGNYYYLFCNDLPTAGDSHVTLFTEGGFKDSFVFEREVESVEWLDNGEVVQYEQKDGKVSIYTVPYIHGKNLVVRVAKIKCRE